MPFSRISSAISSSASGSASGVGLPIAEGAGAAGAGGLAMAAPGVAGSATGSTAAATAIAAECPASKLGQLKLLGSAAGQPQSRSLAKAICCSKPMARAGERCTRTPQRQWTAAPSSRHLSTVGRAVRAALAPSDSSRCLRTRFMAPHPARSSKIRRSHKDRVQSRRDCRLRSTWSNRSRAGPSPDRNRAHPLPGH